jgi:ABC-2 type transport system ATP-binding protein
LADPADHERAAVLAVSGVCKRFGATVAIRDVALELGAGQVLGFVGPNGAGKTTTLRILAGLLRADAGEGQVLGHDIMTAQGLVSERVGYMPQRLALYPELTVSQNLRFRADVYGLADPRAAVEAALDGFDLAPFRARRAAHLSGGWARRLQLAAALIHRPVLVLLDEPTAGLDAESRQDVWRRILALARGGASVVINTHDLAEAEQCSAVALFFEGRVLAAGDPDSLTEAAPVEAAMIAGPDPEALAARLEAQPGVVAAYPHGHRVRVLYRPEALAAVQAEVGAAGALIEPCPKRLEDAALLIARGGAGRADAA